MALKISQSMQDLSHLLQGCVYLLTCANGSDFQGNTNELASYIYLFIYLFLSL